MTDKTMFVPLNSEPWYWFRDGKKTWELRRAKGQFAVDRVKVGRRIELRRGYSTPDSLFGFVEDVAIGAEIESIFRLVNYRKIIPTARSLDAAIERAKSILGPKPGPFIAIKPWLRPSPSDIGKSDD